MRFKLIKFIFLGKSLFWLLLTTFFGLLQLWLIFAYDYLTSQETLTYNSVLLNGSMIFFITAIVTTISVDFFLSKLKFSRFTETSLFVLFPVIIIISSIFLFCICLLKPDVVDIKLLGSCEAALIIATIIYAVTTKTLKFSCE